MLVLAVLCLTAVAAGCGGNEQPSGGTTSGVATESAAPGSNADVTFVELGSDSCVPCKAMRPIMDEIAQKYHGSVEVVFYDIYEQSDRAQEFGVRVIPTQVFLDDQGEEFYRHEGFLTLMAIESLLAKRGIEPATQAQ